MSTSYQWGVLVGILIGIILVAAIFAYNKKKTGTVNGGEFDERQQLLRGKAFQKGFLTMLIVSALYWALILALGRPLMQDGLSAIMLALLGVGVFGFDCILHDAFFTVTNKPKSYIVLMAACTLCQIPSAISNIREGRVMQDGVLSFAVLPIVCAVLFLSILIGIVLKQALPEKED